MTRTVVHASLTRCKFYTMRIVDFFSHNNNNNIERKIIYFGKSTHPPTKWQCGLTLPCVHACCMCVQKQRRMGVWICWVGLAGHGPGGMHVARHLLLATLRGPAHSCYSVALSGLLSLSSSNSNPTPSSLSPCLCFLDLPRTANTVHSWLVNLQWRNE